MARQTNDEKRISQLEQQNLELLAEVEAYRKVIDSKNMDNAKLHQTLDVREKTIQNLQEQINRINDQFEAEEDENNQTIRRSCDMLLRAFKKIKCPITQREAFKQFAAQVVIGIREQARNLDNDIKNAVNTRSFIENNADNIRIFMEDLTSGRVTKHGH